MVISWQMADLWLYKKHFVVNTTRSLATCQHQELHAFLEPHTGQKLSYRKERTKGARGNIKIDFIMSGWRLFPLWSSAVTQTAPLHAGEQPPLSFFHCHWNVSYTWNMSSRTETSPVLITAQPNKPVLHNSSNIAIFTCEAELVIYSWAAFPHVSQSPTEQGVLHQGHNGWFDLKRSNYPQQWSDLIVYWRRRESVIEVKLEVIVSGRCVERWYRLIGCGVWLSENKGLLIHSYQWLGWGPSGGLLYTYWNQKHLVMLLKPFWVLWICSRLNKSQCYNENCEMIVIIAFLQDKDGYLYTQIAVKSTVCVWLNHSFYGW